MKRKDYDKHLLDIVAELDQLTERDARYVKIEPGSNMTMTQLELEGFGERCERRQQLSQELRKLASEPIEE